MLLTVGRLYARKGMDRVIESLPELLGMFPDLVYVIVGEGPYRANLAGLAEALGVADSVIFAGELRDDEVTDHYALADVFIMANRTMPDGDTEGFGLVFLEANACGIPVIAGSAGGSPDAVRDGVNGLVIDGDDAGAIARAVAAVLADALLAARLIRHGLETARQASWDNRVAAFLRYCDGLQVRR